MKKAFLSVAALLTLVTITGCNPSTNVSSTSSSTSSSAEEVKTYTLSVSQPTKTEWEVGEVFDFASIEVKLDTLVNGVSSGVTTLTRDQYIVSVGDNQVDGNFEFANEGTVTFTFKSKEHTEATASFEVTVKQYFTITNLSSESAVLTGLPERSLAGETINFTLTLLPGYYFNETVSILNGSSQPVEFTNEDYTYTFTMPASNVTIAIGTGLNDFVITKDETFIDEIVLENSTEEDKVDMYSAVPGTQLKFKTHEDKDSTFTELYINGEIATLGEDGYYHFVMPHHPVSITTNKTHRTYQIKNESTLTLSTVNMYIDEDKTPITSGYKGQKVYLEFTYTPILVKYDIVINAADKTKVTATQVASGVTSGKDLYSFEMVSSDLTIKITEDDYSKYYGWYVTEKQYKTWEVEGSSKSLDVKKKSELRSMDYAFNSNGQTTRGSSGHETWVTTANKTDTSGILTIKGSTASSDNDVYFTPNMIAMKYKASAEWGDAYIGLWNDEESLHVMKLNDGNTRIAWTEDASRNITDKILITNNNVYTSFELYKDSTKTETCNGGDLTLTSNFYVYVNDETYVKVSNGNSTKPYDLVKTTDEKYTLNITNEAGKEISKAEDGSTVYVSPIVNEGFSERYVIKSVKATYESGTGWWATTVDVTVTKLEDGRYSFVMPKNSTTISCELEDTQKYADYKEVGKYFAYNISDENTGDVDFATEETFEEINIKVDGKLTSTGVDGSIIEHEIQSMKNADKTTFDTKRNNKSLSWDYDNGILIQGSNNYDDSIVGFKVTSDITKNNVKARVHRNEYGTMFAIEFLVNNEVVNAVFVNSYKVYGNVSFVLDEGTSRIGNEGSYQVYQNGKAIFKVAGSTVTQIK